MKEHWLRIMAAGVLAAVMLSAPLFAASPQPGTVIVNTAYADYRDANNNRCPRVNASVSTELGAAPVLRMSKAENSDPVAMGATLVYTLACQNTGNAAATGVVIADNLSSYVVYQSSSGGGVYSPGPPAGGTVTWSLGTLTAGATAVRTVTVRVKTPADYPPGDPQAISIGTVIPNSGVITSGEGASDQVDITTTVGNAPNIVLAKTGTPDQVSPGGTLTYTLQYANQGNAAGHNVQIRDELPTGTAYVDGSANVTPSVDGRTLIWTIGTLEPGAGGVLSFQVTVSPLAADGTIIRNTASVSSTEQATLVSNEQVNYVSSKVALGLTKSDAPDPVRAGNTITYAITLNNDGFVPLTGVLVRDAIPAGTNFVSADKGGMFAGGEVTWNLGTLGVSEVRMVHCTVQVDTAAPAGTIITNTAAASSNEQVEVAASASTTVSSRTPGMVEFVDTDGNPVTLYHAADIQNGANIYVRVNDQDQNADSTREETVLATVLDSNTGQSVTVELTETGPNTGIFVGSFQEPSWGVPDTQLTAYYTDQVDGTQAVPYVAYIDPYGIVFDAVTGSPVAGATVFLCYGGTDTPVNPADLPPGQPNQVITGADGSFSFALLPPGTYRFHVVPPAGSEYSYPSTIPTGDLPPGFVITTGSRGEDFTLTAGMPPVNLDIPVDPPAGELHIAKTASRTTASIGDIVMYTVTVTNNGTAPFTDVQINDTMPHGVLYVRNSTVINGSAAPDPVSAAGRTLVWSLGTIPAGGTVTLTYKAVIGVDSQKGNGKNTVFARGLSSGRPVTSRSASVVIKISEGVFTTKGTIIGRIFIDENSDRMPQDGEKGIAGVALYLEDGTRVISDKDGKYSIYGVRPGTHVLRVDEATLPSGFRLVPVSNRFLGSASSQFVDMVASGLMKANFAVETEAKKAEEKAAGGPKAGLITKIVKETPLEEQIDSMTPEPIFLYPRPDSAVSRDSVNVGIKGPLDAEISLYVNDRKVNEDRLGKKIAQKTNRVVILEYIAVPLSQDGLNIVKFEVRDQFGNLRASREMTVVRVGEPHAVVVKPEKKEVPADGSSLVRIEASAVDSRGQVIPYVQFVTVETSAGEIVEKDADPLAAGLQVPCIDGRTQFTVRAPHEPAEACLTVSFDRLEGTSRVFFAPHLRDMFMIGVGELVLGRGSTQGDLFQDNSWLREGWYGGGRGAFFMKGRVGRDYLVTASYDTKKKTDTDLSREKDTCLESEEQYPIYGDESRLGYEAVSRDKLYVRIDRNKSHAMYGDFQTDLKDTLLSAYTRTFTGFKSELNLDRLSLKLFATRTDQVQVVDALPARGISGYYFLTHRPVVEGSESVVIETRDRRQSERILDRRSAVRGTDYYVDYDLAAILFKTPIPAYDSNLNPLFIVVSYETTDSGNKHFIFGGRAVLKLKPWIDIGFTGVTEQQDVSDYHLMGTDVTVRLPGQTTVKAEYAATDSLLDITGVTTPQKDDAWALTVESAPHNKFRIAGFYKKAGDYFGNLSAVDVMRGTEKYGGEIGYELTDTLLAKARYLNEDDTLNDMNHRYAGLGVEKTWRKAKAEVELYHETANERYIPPANPNSRYPFDISEDIPTEATALRLRIERELMPDLSFVFEGRQNFLAAEDTGGQVGIDYRIDSTRKMYLRQWYGQLSGRTETRTALGIESQLFQDTVAFNEYRLFQGADGGRNQQSIGLRNKFLLGDNITGNFSVENLSTVSGPERQNEPDAFAVATGIEYLPRDNVKITNRLEYRRESGETSNFAELGVVYKFQPDYALLFKERFFYDALTGEARRITSKTLLGLAYRPARHDRFNALVKMEFKNDSDTTTDPGYDSDAYIISMEGVYQPCKTVQYIGKYAGKLARDYGVNTYTDLISARVLYDLTSRLDLGVEYRMLTSHATGSRSVGGSCELGYRAIGNVWVSLGYCFDRFDSDLVGDSYWGKGPFLKLRFKFDEKLFKKKIAGTATIS